MIGRTGSSPVQFMLWQREGVLKQLKKRCLEKYLYNITFSNHSCRRKMGHVQTGKRAVYDCFYRSICRIGVNKGISPNHNSLNFRDKTIFPPLEKCGCFPLISVLRRCNISAQHSQFIVFPFCKWSNQNHSTRIPPFQPTLFCLCSIAVDPSHINGDQTTQNRLYCAKNDQPRSAKCPAERIFDRLSANPQHSSRMFG